MEESLDPVHVTVTGGSYGASTLIFGVVQDAITKAGFRNVKPRLGNSFSDEDSRRISSLLDVVRSIHPDLFSTPVEVHQELEKVRFTDDEVFPTTAALEETIHKAVRNDYVDYYSVVSDQDLGTRSFDEILDAPPVEMGAI